MQPAAYAYIRIRGFRIQKHDDDDDDAGEEEEDEARIPTVALSRALLCVIPGTKFPMKIVERRAAMITLCRRRIYNNDNITLTYHERGRAEWQAGAPVSRVERRPSRWPGSRARVDPPRGSDFGPACGAMHTNIHIGKLCARI
uniref:Uncharacterized protein n=1 Tax=Trichogramma kaykai TaxID=54128 RepID=A0ABD2XN64_9HYME